jgi:hypothetical protein
MKFFTKSVYRLFLVSLIGFINPAYVTAQTFSPTVSVTLANTDCNNLTDLTISVSQDANETDILSSLFASNSGSFDIANMSIGDIIGSAVMSANGGANTFNAELTVTSIISSNQAIVQAQDINTGLVLGSFTIINTNPGVSITATTVPDGNNFTNGNSQTVTFTNVFVNPGAGSLVFTTSLDSELGDQDIQSFSFTIACLLDFSPTVSVLLSSTDCNGLSDLTISVSQDANETDILSSLFASNSGSFDIANMSIGDIIGSAVMSANGGANTFNAELTVTSIISSNQAIVQAQDINTGLVLGSFTIINTNPGVSITATTVPDGNNFTNGNSQTVTFTNVFVNPGAGSLVFTTSLDSELGDQDIQSFSFTIACLSICLQLGDANCDGIVNLDDLTLVIINWLQSTPVGENGDVVGSLDGFVNLDDLTLVIVNWLQSTP